MNRQFEIVDGVAVNKGIGWCSHTASPIKFRLKVDITDKDTGEVLKRAGETVWFCVKVSTGCSRCYSERLALRWGQLPFTVDNLSKVEPFVDEKVLRQILTMKVKGPYPEPHTRPALFLEDMSDLLADFIPFEMVDRVLAVCALRPDITFFLLTKRAERMVEYFGDGHPSGRALQVRINGNDLRSFSSDQLSAWSFPLPNVLLGFSAEDQPNFDARWAHMRKLAAMGWKVFCSAEPLIGLIDLTRADYTAELQRTLDDFCEYKGYPKEEYGPKGSAFRNALTGSWDDGEDRGNEDTGHLSWVIVGGESGASARPFDVEWMRSAIRQCKAAGCAFFGKQLGAVPIVTEAEWRAQKTMPLLSARANGRGVPEGYVALATGDSHGADWEGWPSMLNDLKVRELPEIGR